MDLEIIEIKRDISNFFHNNKERYENFNKLQEYLDHINENTYSLAIQFIEQRKNFFFQDHPTTIFFLVNMIYTAEYNFKHIEHYFDVLVYFKQEIIRGANSEEEILCLCSIYPISVNYLFYKQFFSIESIFKISSTDKYIFTIFYPEIEQYDQEYAQKCASRYFQYKSDKLYYFYTFAKSNPKQHIQYRNSFYHQSRLHKSIRDDDVDTFQSLLSQNNFNINHKIEHSIFERAKTLDDDLSLIQISALYGSLSIFKFLWMQTEIVLDDNLLCYAFFGRNIEIIHICEEKCSKENIWMQPILTHRMDLLDYIIDNYSDIIKEEDETVSEILSKSEINSEVISKSGINIFDNYYEIIDYSSLIESVLTFNYEVMRKCMTKIVFISKNYKCDSYYSDALFNNCGYDFEFFKFIFDQKKSTEEKYDYSGFIYSLSFLLSQHENDAFKFLFNYLKNLNKLNYIDLFRYSLEFNHEMANFMLDLQIKEIESEVDKKIIFDDINNKISIYFDFSIAFQFYNEDIIVKMMKLYYKNNTDLKIIIHPMNTYLSQKMINSLMTRLSSVLPKNLLDELALTIDKNHQNK